MTYTYDDIVTAKDILTGRVKKEDIIGKKGWFFDCIPQDMRLNTIMRSTRFHCLEYVDLSSNCPFFPEDECSWTYFLPEKEESYKERQAKWVKANNLKPGDKVRILRTAEKNEDGWGITWVLQMDETVGEIGTVMDIFDDDSGIRVDRWIYPYFVLEKVNEPAYIPFDLSREEDRNFLRGKWIISKSEGREEMITAFHTLDSGKWTADCSNFANATGEGLLRFYTFLDGSVIGKPANDQQMTSK